MRVLAHRGKISGRRVRARARLRIACLISMALLAGTVSTPVLAACSPSRDTDSTSHYAGTAKGFGDNTAYSIHANIEEYSPYVAGSRDSVSAWVMLTRPRAASGAGYWAQAGWIKRVYDGVVTRNSWIQWVIPPAGVMDRDFGTEATGTFTHYHVIYEFNVPQTRFEFAVGKDSSEVYRVTTTWRPRGVQVFGETHRQDSQMPGGINNKVKFAGVQYELSSGWSSMGTPAQAEPVHGATKLSDFAYEIWDRACSH